MIGVINFFNVKRMITQADGLLAMLSENDGYFPGMLKDGDPNNFNPVKPEDVQGQALDEERKKEFENPGNLTDLIPTNLPRCLSRQDIFG